MSDFQHREAEFERAAAKRVRAKWLDFAFSPGHAWLWAMFGVIWAIGFFYSPTPEMKTLSGALFLIHAALLIGTIVRAIRIGALQREEAAIYRRLNA